MDSKVMTELWTAISEKAEPGSRIIFRTAGAESPLTANLPSELLAKFRYEKETSERLFREDRASIYGGFHLYVLNNG
jgi:S-adenosylmethionine-diacylglycerol 3-amino-3-carboxypropyl transferase